MKINILNVFKNAFSIRTNFTNLFYVNDNYINSLDGWRTIARFLVGINHCMILMSFSPYISNNKLSEMSNQVPFWFYHHGNFGVDILFVLSGFLIGVILLKEKKTTQSINIKRFYFRRAMRILPAYFVAIVFAKYCWLRGWVPNNGFMSSFWPNIFYVNNFVSYATQFMKWTWSLAIEEQFYLFCPIFFYFSSIDIKKFFSSLFVVFIFCKVAHLYFLTTIDFKFYWSQFPELGGVDYNLYFDWIYGNTFVRFPSILIGVACAYLYEFKKIDRLFASKIHSTFYVSVAVICITYILNQMNYDIAQPNKNIFFEYIYRDLFAVSFALLLLASIRLKVLRNIFSARIFIPLSHLSYSVYLVHVLFMMVILRNQYPLVVRLTGLDVTNPTGKGIFLFTLYTTILSYFAALVMYVLVEKPMINLREYFSMGKANGGVGRI